jgi:hypothetical protein
MSGDERTDGPRGVGIPLGTDMGAGMAINNLRRGAAQARRHLDHVTVAYVGKGQQPVGKFHAARA